MKKYLLLLLSITLSSQIFAQTIGFRDDNSEVLSIGTDYLITRSFGAYDTGVALSIYTDKKIGEKKIVLSLYVETYGRTVCQKHSRAIFKTFSGSIITVSEILDTYKVQNGWVGNSNKFYLKPHYLISESDFNTLMKEGIQLIRIETLKGLKDFTYKSDVIGGYLTKEYNLIMGKQDFEADF